MGADFVGLGIPGASLRSGKGSSALELHGLEQELRR